MYRFEGIDRTGKSVTGIYHGDGNTTSQWLNKFINLTIIDTYYLLNCIICTSFNEPFIERIG